MSKVFISYSHKDAEFARRLAWDLTSHGLSVFYDQVVPPGESWAEALAQAVENSEYILAVLSPDYFSSQWAHEELNVGMLREADGRAKVIPVLVRPCALPDFLASKTYADFRDDYGAGLQRLLPVLTNTAPTVPDVSHPGEFTRDIDPKEVASLRTELRQAVELFRGNPARDSLGNQEVNSLKSGRQCFIVMPFGDPDLEVVYEDFLKPILINDCHLQCERGDDVFGSNVIMDDILTSIRASDLVVADLTRKNANVFYEVGICHALQKPVLLLAQSLDDVPFDLRHRRVLLYEYTPRGCKRLERSLRDNVSAMLSS